MYLKYNVPFKSDGPTLTPACSWREWARAYHLGATVKTTTVCTLCATVAVGSHLCWRVGENHMNLLPNSSGSKVNPAALQNPNPKNARIHKTNSKCTPLSLAPGDLPRAGRRASENTQDSGTKGEPTVVWSGPAPETPFPDSVVAEVEFVVSPSKSPMPLGSTDIPRTFALWPFLPSYLPWGSRACGLQAECLTPEPQASARSQ